MEPGAAWSAYQAGHLLVRDWLAVLPADVMALPSVLHGWTVKDLAAHLALVANSVARLTEAPRGERPSPSPGTLLVTPLQPK